MAKLPLDTRALCEAVAEQVRERILNHEFPPGQALDEGRLLKDYGVSRTPVREALKLLQHEGLLTARPHRGMMVTQLEAGEREEALILHRLLSLHAQATTQTGPDRSRVPLVERLLAITRAQLRLAYGPSAAPVFTMDVDDPNTSASATGSGT